MISYEPLFQTMREKGITSYRLFKLGFPQSNYYAIKRGENISTHTVNELCRILDCNVADIMTYIDKKQGRSHCPALFSLDNKRRFLPTFRSRGPKDVRRPPASVTHWLAALT